MVDIKVDMKEITEPHLQGVFIKAIFDFTKNGINIDGIVHITGFRKDRVENAIKRLQRHGYLN